MSSSSSGSEEDEVGPPNKKASDSGSSKPSGKAKKRIVTRKYSRKWESDPAFKGEQVSSDYVVKLIVCFFNLMFAFLLSDWIMQYPTDGSKAYCKRCSVSLKSHSTSLKKHAESDQHKRSSTAVAVTPSINTLFLPSPNPASLAKNVKVQKVRVY